MTEQPPSQAPADKASDSSSSVATPKTPKVPFWSPLSKRRKFFHAFVLLVIVLGLATVWSLLMKWNEWGSRIDKMVVFSIPFVVAMMFAILFHKVMRAKTKVYADWLEANPDDPRGQEILVIFNWSRKVLYFYTILVCVVNAVLMILKNQGILPELSARLLGGIWLGVFFLNFLIEEYEVNLTSLLISVFGIVAMCLWFAFMGWWDEFMRFFQKFGMEIDAAGYILIGSVFVIAILYSYIKGAFHYVAITPNFINIQSGIAETGEQIQRDAYTTRVDAGDLLERWMPLLNFGKIVITFRDTRRMPMEFLVHRIGTAAQKLERICGILRVDGRDH